jgi:hypothetical protein
VLAARERHHRWHWFSCVQHHDATLRALELPPPAQLHCMRLALVQATHHAV